MSKQYPEVLADLAEQAALTVVEEGGSQKLAALVGCALAERMRRHWGGLQIYVPKGLKLQLAARDLEIFKEFDGTNANEICRKYGISARALYRAVNGVRAKKKQSARK